MCKCLLTSFATILLFGSGCAKTEMHSFVDPEFRGRSYHDIIVAVQLDKLDQRDDAESIFVRKLASPTLKCRRALDVIPPTRQYDDAELKKALSQSDADGLLLVRMTQYYEDEVYVPPSSTTYTSGNLSANTYYYGKQANTYGRVNSTSHTYTTGGQTYRLPRVRHEAQLWDVTSGKMAWIGGTFTSGNAYARFGNLMTSLAGEVQATLVKEGLVAANTK